VKAHRGCQGTSYARSRERYQWTIGSVQQKPNLNVNEQNHREARPGTVERKKAAERRRAQSQRDKSRNRREEEEKISRIARVTQRHNGSTSGQAHAEHCQVVIHDLDLCNFT
jgi:hypothetical protein